MKNWIISCLLLATTGVCAQETAPTNEFSLSAQIRPRAEYRNGALFPRSAGEDPAYFINNRTRLSMEYKRNDLSLKISGQHVGVWGQDPQVDKKNDGHLALNEAWARLNFGTGFFAQFGRQTLSYDDERILGALDWNVAGRYHDALKIGYAGGNHQLHLIFAFNQNGEKIAGGSYYHPGGQPYKNMETAWYHYQSPKQHFNASLLFINLGLETGDAATEDARTRYLQTMGTYLTFRTGKWNLSGALYYQTGKNTVDQDVSAYMWNLRAQYNLNEKWSFVIASDYLSGNEPGNKTFKAFNPLYGTHHKFYGGMDYFYASDFAAGFNPGLWDNQLGIGFNICQKAGLNLTYHYFSATTDIEFKGEDYERSLGSEIDLQLDIHLMKDVKLSAGYSFMAGSSAMDVVKGGDHNSWQDWGWLSLNINPQVFFTKW